MRLKQILNESYYDGLYHLTSQRNLTKDNMNDMLEIKRYLPDKPEGGIWLAKGLSWLRYLKDHGHMENMGVYKLYRVRINPKAKILDLRKKSDKDWLELKGKKNQKFSKDIPHEKYLKQKGNLKEIDFKKVAEEFDGARGYNLGKSSYDVPSVIIFNRDVIQNIEYVDTAENILEKM